MIAITHEGWRSARSKLATNLGNVIHQSDMLREPGVKPTKQLPAKLIKQARGATLH
jgi:hypothetical protein